MDHRRLRKPLQLRSSFLGPLLYRQTNLKSGAAPGCVFDCNGPAVCFDDRAHDGQTHSKALFLCCEKMLEESHARCLCNPVAVVTYGIPIRAVAIGTSGNLDDPATHAGFSHCIKRIADQVNEHLLNLSGIGFDAWQIWRE